MSNVKPNLMPLLKELGLTQMQLSEKSGVPQGSISRFDKNTRHEANHLFAISEALGVPIEKLFIREQEE
ncbi:helix-turn-helix domain-containing protein [Paenibacillus graminis]|uniref:Transcriptional regulator n=1 Tax=Paenibacillus graminis TaxID=189425 RepID=A0A089MDI0_9BACL|nr:helix-turn-helix transcriptional regulator [Paenibacillus graminis]AIQ70390.1 transcriptional regulator [Paenibacillus graminis]MEC0170297.1 helix-turn-helix transcriptional regulator [Paenibacillus graminis]